MRVILERAQQTAAFVGSALGLPVHSDRALRERCFGVFEGRPLHALGPVQSGIGTSGSSTPRRALRAESRSTSSTSGRGCSWTAWGIDPIQATW